MHWNSLCLWQTNAPQLPVYQFTNIEINDSPWTRNALELCWTDGLYTRILKELQDKKKCKLKKRPSSTKSQNYKNKHSGLVFGEQNSSSGTN